MKKTSFTFSSRAVAITPIKRKASRKAAKNLAEIFADALKTTALRTCSTSVLGGVEIGSTLGTPILRRSKIVAAFHAESELLAFAAAVEGILTTTKGAR